MKRKNSVLFLVALFFVSGCARLFHPEYTVVLTSQNIEEKLNKKFPVEEKLGNFAIVFENLKVDIKESVIFLKVHYSARFFKIPFSEGEIVLSGKPAVDKTGKNLYIKKLKVEAVKINGKEILNSKLKRAVSAALSEVLKETPVFKLKNRMKIKSIKIHDGKIYVKLQL